MRILLNFAELADGRALKSIFDLVCPLPNDFGQCWRIRDFVHLFMTWLTFTMFLAVSRDILFKEARTENHIKTCNSEQKDAKPKNYYLGKVT